MAAKMDRRGFLQAGAVTAAALVLPVSKVSELDTGDKEPLPTIRLGVASYSFRKFGQPDVIRYMKELRTPYLNVKEFHLPITPAADVKLVSARYRDDGITLTAAGTIYFTKDDDGDMKAKFEYVRAAGIPLIVAGPTPETLPRLERFAKEYDIKIAIHNHGPEDKYFPSPLDALKAIKRMDPRMGLCVDVGHTARCGVDVPSAIREVGPRLYDVHMKDLANDGGKWTQVAVGDGSLPVEKIFAALIAIRYPGFVDLEYEIHEDDPMPGMIKSIAYMRGVVAGMGNAA
jgi:sugar phosphate isomerase/epimerase